MIEAVKRVAKVVVGPTAYQRFRSNLWRYVRPLLADYCPAPLPWFSSVRGRDPASLVKRQALSYFWEGKFNALTLACQTYAVATWPLRLAAEVPRCMRRYSRHVKEHAGVGYVRQFGQVLRCSVLDNIPPEFYYRYRIYALEDLGRAHAFLLESEMNVLYPNLVEGVTQPFDLSDKREFFEAAEERGLPTAGAVAAFAPGGETIWYRDGAGECSPVCDLVLKPVDLACGRGVEVWEHDAGRACWSGEAGRLDADGLVARGRSLAAAHNHPFLLQPRVRNHPDLAPLCGAGLCTIRVVTYRMPEEAPEILLACLRMPTGGSRVDNFAAEGIAAPVDLETGRVGRAVGKDPRRGTFAVHPDSGGAIEGFVVPCWGEAQELAMRAHAAFPWLPTVGWDVVMTPDGPILLETNTNWGVELAQIPTGRPLGETAYPVVYLAHRARREGLAHLQTA